MLRAEHRTSRPTAIADWLAWSRVPWRVGKQSADPRVVKQSLRDHGLPPARDKTPIAAVQRGPNYPARLEQARMQSPGGTGGAIDENWSRRQCFRSMAVFHVLLFDVRLPKNDGANEARASKRNTLP